MASPVLNDQDHQLAARLSNLPGPKANADAARAIDGGAFYLTHASSGYGIGKVLELGASGFSATLTTGRALRVMITALDGTAGYAVVTKGLVQGLSGLTAGAFYYVDTSGALVTTLQAISAGYALSSTTLLFDGQADPPKVSAPPIGTILPYSGLFLPDHYLWCAGQDVSIESYPELYFAIGLINSASPTYKAFTVAYTNGSTTVTSSSAHGYTVGMPFNSSIQLSTDLPTPDPYGADNKQDLPCYILSVLSSTTFTIAMVGTTTALTFNSSDSGRNVLTVFRVPDLRGRVFAGRDNMSGLAGGRLTNISNGFGASAEYLASFGGQQNHLLLSTESGVPSHVHGYTGGNSVNRTNTGAATGGVAAGVTAANAAANASQAHNNCQPTWIGNYIIRAL